MKDGLCTAVIALLSLGCVAAFAFGLHLGSKDRGRPGDYESVGIGVLMQKPRSSTLLGVSKVYENSPAWDAGMRDRATVVALNGIATSTLSLSDARDILNDRRETEVEVSFVNYGLDTQKKIQTKIIPKQRYFCINQTSVELTTPDKLMYTVEDVSGEEWHCGCVR